MPVVSVRNESICFKIGDIKNIGLKEYVLKKMKRQYFVQQMWANKDISFELEKGDMLGIIGMNGAGKSTLLKAISGVFEPTAGSIRIRGNVAALLELTAGFDGDLTVRENTYLRGALLGYTRDYINKMYDEIIAFAELQDYQERAFKQLSSGMKSRLAFSIACLVNPDIIILDEVLSVGDGAFREKSEKKMMEILNRGVTGLFVSHSVAQVRRLCNKILWLDKGKQVVFSNEVQMICDSYEEYLITRELPQNLEDHARMSEAWQIRQQEKARIKQEKQKEKLVKELESKSSEAALDAAVEIIKKQRPELAAMMSSYLPVEQSQE